MRFIVRAFSIFAVGTLLVLIGVGYAMARLGVPTVWIVVAVLIIAGIGIASGASLAKRNKSSDTDVKIEENKAEHS